jgi:hypothetical protein
MTAASRSPAMANSEHFEAGSPAVTCHEHEVETILRDFSPCNMPASPPKQQHPIRVIKVDGHDYMVSLRVGYDGVEHLGRLWFTDIADAELSFQDHGAIPGVSVEEATRKAAALTLTELESRLHRAQSEKRRFGKLRSATGRMIDQIKYLNRVVVSLQKGLIDRDGGHREIEEIQQKILEIVKTFPIHAGVESE